MSVQEIRGFFAWKGGKKKKKFLRGKRKKKKVHCRQVQPLNLRTESPRKKKERGFPLQEEGKPSNFARPRVKRGKRKKLRREGGKREKKKKNPETR